MIKIPKSVMVAVKNITPCARNTKKHPQSQIDNVAKSIEKFGFIQPIVLDENNEIIIGHCRLSASKKLGMKEVPCVYVEDLTDDEVRQLRILDNKLNESDWELDILADELNELDFGEFDLDFGIVTLDDSFGEDFSLPDGDKSEICQMTFTLHEEQASLIKYAMDLVKDDICETFGNQNSNGNALYEVIRQWAEQRK